MPRQRSSDLLKLAALYGVQTAYYDVDQRRRHTSPDTLCRILALLGAPLERPHEAAAALRHRRLECSRRALEPVIVLWQGGAAEVPLRLPSAQRDPLDAHLTLEDGSRRSWRVSPDSLPTAHTHAVEGAAFCVYRLPLPEPPPIGYHRLALEQRSAAHEALLVAAPRRTYQPPHSRRHRTWGALLPLYALHSRRSLGAGDLTDLERLLEWIGGLGGSFVATLPLLATFCDQPEDFAPYSPASRVMWNEFYLDLARLSEEQPGAESARWRRLPETEAAIAAFASQRLVDYPRESALRRHWLTLLADEFFALPAAQQQPLVDFLAHRPDVDLYARFRAACRRHGRPWTGWPAAQRGGTLSPADYDEHDRRYHAYAQWRTDQQLARLSQAALARRQTLYLDLPLGTHPDGFDTWRYGDVFAQGACGGAPPDAFFTAGQNWGFAPLAPEPLRHSGYRYLIDTLRHHLQYAHLLRIDHAMGLHRLYWIPAGADARDGAYVRYPAEELYAVLAVESHRHQAVVIGENLGTVPRHITPALHRHGIDGMYVLQFDVGTRPQRAVGAAPRAAVASLNTHDVPPLAAFWHGDDIDDRADLGLVTGDDVALEKRGRAAQREALAAYLVEHGWLEGSPDDLAAIVHACLALLAAGPARRVVVNLEDLWLERHPQNVPGTVHQRPNWRRKAQLSFDEFSVRPDVLAALARVDRCRRSRWTPPPA